MKIIHVRRHGIVISLSIILCFCSLQIATNSHLINQGASAATQPTSTVQVSYTPHLTQQLVQNQYFSSLSTLSVQVSVKAPTRFKIARISQKTASGSLVDISPAQAIGLTTYNGSVILRGSPLLAKSVSNDSLQGYYAWYRNKAVANGGGYWYADLSTTQQKNRTFACGSAQKEKVNAQWIAQYPGCSSKTFLNGESLLLQAVINKPFLQTGQSTAIPAKAISNIRVVQARVNGQALINGPSGVQAGYAMSQNIEIINVQPVQQLNTNEFKVLFHQNFDYPSQYTKEMSTPPDGRKLMVYYIAFMLDFEGTSYQYPNDLVVEYIPASAPLPSATLPPATPAPVSNLPTELDIQWAPKPLWEGDTVELQGKLNLPNANTYRYTWLIQGPGGQQTGYEGRNLKVLWTKPGPYQVSLTATFGNMVISKSVMIEVFPLELEADVTHTADWLKHHLQKKHQVANNPKDFYSGERFIIQSVGSQAPIREVVAWLDSRGIDNKQIVISQKLTQQAVAWRYGGELYSPKLQSFTEGLSVGEHRIFVKMTYQNGVIKQKVIPLRIIANVLDAVGVHRMQ